MFEWPNRLIGSTQIITRIPPKAEVEKSGKEKRRERRKQQRKNK